MPKSRLQETLEHLGRISARESDADRLRRAGGHDFGEWEPYISPRQHRCYCGHPIPEGEVLCISCMLRK